MQKAVTPPVRRADYYDQSEPVQNRVYKSLKLWSMYADLEESIGTFQVRIAFIFTVFTIYCIEYNVVVWS